MGDPSFTSACKVRAGQEGSSIPAVKLNVSWSEKGDTIELKFPGGAPGAKLADAIQGRLKFGRGLVVVSTLGPPIVFEPAEVFALHVTAQGLVVQGALHDAAFIRFLAHPQEAVLRYIVG